MPEIGTQQGLGIRACRRCWMRWVPFVLSCSPVADASLQLRQSSGLFSAPSLHPALVLSELSPAWCPLHPPFPKTPANPAVWLSPCQRFCSAFLRVTGKSACQPQVVFPEDQLGDVREIRHLSFSRAALLKNIPWILIGNPLQSQVL